MPRIAGMPMGEGTPRKQEGHEIFEDGTYSNRPTTEVQAPVHKEPKIMTIFKTKNGSQYQVMHLAYGGIYVCGYPYDRQPRVQDCDFWELSKFHAERVDG